MKLSTIVFGILLIISTGCDQKTVDLPIIGDRTELDGTKLEHKIRDFNFQDQIGNDVTNAQFKDKIHVVDFFFTSCPSICPKVTAEMLKIYNNNVGHDDIILVSHTIDPVRDSVPVLKKYADNLNIDHKKWLFLRGPKDEIMEIANEDYFVAALESPDAPGGFDHSGKIILLDKEAKIRGFCDGTDSESVTKFIKTIEVLRKSYE